MVNKHFESCFLFIFVLYFTVIQCPPLTTDDTHLRIESNNRTYGSRVMFSCPTGYRLVGSPVIICLKNQTWSDVPPYCEGIVKLKLYFYAVTQIVAYLLRVTAQIIVTSLISYLFMFTDCLSNAR